MRAATVRERCRPANVTRGQAASWQLRRNMKMFKPCLSLLAVVVVGTLAGCSTSRQAPDVSASIRTSLDQVGAKDVSLSQDREKGVVTLGGHVAADDDKRHL